MSWRMAACAAAFSGCLVFGAASAAALDGSQVILGFGDQYGAPDGSTCTHRGADVALDVGARVDAPLAGTVRFSGRVPGPHGGMVEAVTISTAEGLVSVMPLGSRAVTKGDEVDSGDELGRVAQSGDPSSPQSHVHVSLRHADMYVDPSILLAAAPVPKSPPTAEPAPAPSPAPSPKPRGSTAKSGRSISTGGSVPVGAVALGAADAPAPASFGTEVGATSSMGEGVSISPGSASAVQPPVAVRASVTGLPTAEISAAERLRAIACEAGLGVLMWLRGASSTTVIAVVMVLAVCSSLLAKRAVERKVVSSSPVSDRLGKLLQQLRAG